MFCLAPCVKGIISASEGWLLFIIAMLTMILTPVVLYTLLKEYVRRKKL